ncbi:chorismate mutase [Candidatus Bathyarchaeota archaeon]|nr:chorismate mutase [Candidatus Bathyarchaeota archaeon]MBS7631332.1 chorismate mutase [Candidatus Bathyarchaeota archaeon]
MFEDEVAPLREEIDRLNREIAAKIAERVDIAIRIGSIKAKYNLPVVDESREVRVYEQVQKLAEQHNLSVEGLKRVFREIISLCVDAEKEKR